MILQTGRLLLRELRQSDFQDLSEILQDPEVVYAYEHEFTEKDVQEWLDRQLARYSKYGFGLWAAVIKETGEMAGQAVHNQLLEPAGRNRSEDGEYAIT